MSSCSIVCRRSLLRKSSSCVGGRQLAVDQQVATSTKSQFAAELLDRIAAVAEDALFAVEKRDGAGRRAGVHVAFVERDVAGLGPQLGDVDGRLVLRCRRRRAIPTPSSSMLSLATSVIEEFLSDAILIPAVSRCSKRGPRPRRCCVTPVYRRATSRSIGRHATI